LEAALVEPIQRYLFARDERPVAEHVLALCRTRGWTLATAESCTGGMAAVRLTDVAGASDVFLGAVVAYSNELKQAELGVPAEVLERHGAVSAETAEAMAGPGGGSDEKPVGLVHLHAASPEGEQAQEFTIPGDRDAIRKRATVMALHLLRRLLSQNRHEDV
jgi:nicotinamide-nucleotide amidase